MEVPDMTIKVTLKEVHLRIRAEAERQLARFDRFIARIDAGLGPSK